MSVDFRSRSDSEQTPVSAGAFFRETLPARLDAHRDCLAPGARERSLVDLCIETEGEPFTLAWHGDRVEVSEGRTGRARVRLCAEQLCDLVNDQATPIAWMSNKRLDMPEGGLPQLLDWWLVLRAALDGRRIHTRGDVAFAGPVRRPFDPDDDAAEMRAFLEDTGYLHIRGLFDAEEMAAVAADFAAAEPHYAKGDPKAWFASTHDGEEHLVRMEGFERYSPTSAALLDGERFQRLGRIPGVGHEPRSEAANRVSALSKPIGVVKGISDVPWHKDCSLGRHSYECCGLTVGISVDGAGPDSGQLRVVPGSHRALVWPSPCLQPGLDLEPLDLPTETGDVTVHLSCTLHMAQPPRVRPRKVLYTGFRLEPRDAEAAALGRERLASVRAKTHTRVSQRPGYLGGDARKPS